MIQKRTLEIFRGGASIEREIVYEGTPKQIAEQMKHDEEELLYYMRTGDEKGERSFVFRDFIFRKAGIEAAVFSEPLF